MGAGVRRQRTAAAIVGIVCLGLLVAAVPSPLWACSSLRVDNGDTVLFGANFDYYQVDEGLLFVNPRGLQKTGLDRSTEGIRASWRSRYASITFNLAGYHYAWAGINEKGLVLSTMALDETRVAPPDERPPLDSGIWMQMVLDTCATVEEAVATDRLVRLIVIADSAVREIMHVFASFPCQPFDHRRPSRRVRPLTHGAP